MAVCKACGSTLESRDVQMRSADEAHTTIVSCPSCPVNPNKINSTRMPSAPLRGMNRRVRRSLPVIPRKCENVRSLYAITVDIPSSHHLASVELGLRHLVQYSQFYNKRASDTVSDRVLSAYSVIEGIFKGNCVSFRSGFNIGMGVSLDTYDMLAVSEDTGHQVIIRGTYCNWSSTAGYKSYVYCDYGGKNRKLIVELGSESPSNNKVESIVGTLYGQGMVPDNISRYVSPDSIAVFSNLSPRGWDASIPPKSGHKFTCKPDGQNVWLLWVGNIWYKFSPRCRGKTKGWVWTNTNNGNDTVVISAEDMMSHGCIVIDCFTDRNGAVADSARDINWVVDTARSISRDSTELPIVLRKYFDSYDYAIEYSNGLLYPIDGIVAIRDGSTEILKIKPMRSMELQLAENRILEASDGTPVIACPTHIAAMYDTGSLLEVRFETSAHNSIRVTDIFKRPDKENANSSDAVSNIIRSAHKLLTPEDNERRVALLWCNSLRKELYSLARDRKSTKSIIVDIGTGTGQSLDSVPQSDSVSYVFVEPDGDKCRSIAKRLGIRKIIADPAEMISVIKSLKTRATKSIVVNCYISDILEHERVSTMLFSETRSVTCTFSMQFVIEELHHITSAYNVPVYGCGYTYDSADDDGLLVDDCGVSMKRQDYGTATIKWGGDKSYDEPMTMRRDYAGIGTVIPGSEIIALPDRALASGAFNICKHVTAMLP